MENIGKIHKHIDNGGITVNVNYDSDQGYTIIEFHTSYYGYPDISATLKTWGTIPAKNGCGDVDFLRELGVMFIEAASKVEKLFNKWVKEQNFSKDD